MWKRLAFTAATCALLSMVFHDPAVRARIVLSLRHRHRALMLPAWAFEYEAQSYFRRMVKLTELEHLSGNRPRIRANKGVKAWPRANSPSLWVM